MPQLTAATRAARRQQILEGALQCFAELGFHAATMGDIAAAVGMSAANLYRHFASKSALVEAIAAERHRREIALIDAAFAGADAPTALHRLCDRFVEWLRDPQERLRRRVGVEVWAHGLREPDTGSVMKRGMGQYRQLLRHLERARKRGELPDTLDASSVARVLLAVFQGVILQQAYEPRLDLERLAPSAHRLIDALVAAPTPASRAPRSPGAASPAAAFRT